MSKDYKVILASVIIFYILSPNHCISQGWEWQNPLPTGNPILCSDFVDSLNGWFGSSAGTILHTTDGGNNWEIQHTGINDLYCESIDFIDHQEGWATGREDFGYAYILHTTDGGRNWMVQLVYMSLTLSIVTFKDHRHGWVGTGSGDIYYTIDGGANWELGYTGDGRVRSIAFLDTLHGWAEGQGMPLLYSEDSGRSWSADTTGIIGVKVFFSDSLHGWITSWEKVLRTVDGGTTWLDDLPNVSDELLKDIFFVDTLAGWVTSGEEGTFRTVDGGWTWEQITTTWPEFEWGVYLFFTPLSGWIGFSRTWDGGETLIYQKEGFTLSPVSDVDFIDENRGWVVGYDGIIAQTIDGGITWQLQESGTESRLNSVFALDERRVWAVGWGGVILHTIDGGETWHLQHYSFGSRTAHRAVVFVDSLKGWIAGGKINTGGWILYTEDGGNSWEEISTNFVELSDVTFVDENKGWAVGSGGIIYHSCDGGETWTEQLSSGPDSKIVFLNEYTGWASGVSPGRVWGTTDGGETWTLLVDTLSYGLWGMDFVNENIGWVVGTLGYIWKTEDGGQSWQGQRSGTTKTLWAVDVVNEIEGWIVGDNGSILHTTTGGTSYVEDDITSEYTAEEFHLYPNYPNLFNASTTIKYGLPEDSRVSINVYNIMGQKVATLIDEHQPAGYHQISWDATGHSSGIYFYNIQADDFQKVRKMVLVK